jgi:hypothetical protein
MSCYQGPYSTAFHLVCFEDWAQQPSWLAPRAWHVLQGEIFGAGAEVRQGFTRFANNRIPGMRTVAYDCTAQRVCAVAHWQRDSVMSWRLVYSYAYRDCAEIWLWDLLALKVAEWFGQYAVNRAQHCTWEGHVRWPHGLVVDFLHYCTATGQCSYGREDVQFE